VLIHVLWWPNPAKGDGPAVYAIKDARIVTVSGPTIDKGTIVFRDGLITAVGASVPIPADARVIEAAGMTVYPGLIDAYTDLGLPSAPSPQVTVRTGGAPPAAPPAPPQPAPPSHTQPEFFAARRLEAGGPRLESARAAGITTALTIGRTGIFIGHSALINLAGDTPQKMVVKSPVALHIGFSPTGGFGGSFPTSLMGVFAHIRQMLLDAQHYAAQWERYRRNPRGMQRPEYNEALEALQPVVTGERPVVFLANSETEIRRVISLAEEFNLKYMVSGAVGAAPVARVLAEKKVPVLLNMNFPQRPREADPEADEPLRVLRLRAEAPAAAAALHRAGVRMAFHSGYAQNPRDFLRNVAKAIAAGLPRDAALKALTLHAAEIFGVAEQLGSLEVGKIANLVVTDGDLFDEKTKITHLFIDGREVELRPEPERPTGPPPAAPSPPPDVSGTWSVTVDSPQGAVPVTLQLRQEGTTLSGTVTSPFGQTPIARGTLSGDQMELTVNATIQGNQVVVTFSGRVEGDRISGLVTVEGQGSFTFSGTRSPRAEAAISPGVPLTQEAML
jgi:imidazolonepropionase-like amidohydrolase